MPYTFHKYWIIVITFSVFFSSNSFGQNSLALSYNSATANTVFNSTSIHNGKKVYSHRPIENLPAGGTALLILNVSSISGNPQAELSMWNPNNRNDFWYSPGPQSLTLGQNILTVGPNVAQTYFRYEIKLGSGDQITIDSFGVQGYDLINNTPLNVELFNGSFDDIQWVEEVMDDPPNNEIQDYVRGFTRINDDGDLVLKIARNNINQYKSSRLNSSPTNIALQSGEKLSVEFEAKLPRPEDINGNFVANTPIWPALWIMGSEVYDGNIGWPYCGEIDAMEWSPTRTGTTAFSSAYHWNNWDYYESGGNQDYFSFNTNHNLALYNTYNKWRVDIYRYDDGININKIEMFFNDQFIPGSRITMDSNNQEFWWPVTNRNPQSFNPNSAKNYIFIMNIAMGGWYPGIDVPVPAAFDHAEMYVRNVDYSISSLEGVVSDTVVTFSGPFGGAVANNNTYSVATGSEAWAGFANQDTSVYPYTFPNGGTITFTGESAAPVDLNFKFERLPYDAEGNGVADTEPSFSTATVTVNGAAAEYSVEIPAQDAANTYRSFLLYLTTLDRAVTLTNVTVTANTEPFEPNDIYALNLNFDPNKMTITQSPNKSLYYQDETVLVTATPLQGYVLGDSSWVSKSLVMTSDQSYSISAYPDYNDNDNDGLSNYIEVQSGTDLNDPDSDNDGFTDGEEFENGSNPNRADYSLTLNYDPNRLSIIKSPNNTLYEMGTTVLIETTAKPGFVLADNSWTTKTLQLNSNQTYSISAYPDYNDSDSDGLSNYREALFNSDQNKRDTDNDGTNDYFEYVAGTHPNDPSDTFIIESFSISRDSFHIAYDSEEGRDYRIYVSSDLSNWTLWRTLSGSQTRHVHVFSNQESINLGIENSSSKYFFRVDIIKTD
jgi:hypothetical protein